MTEVTIAMIVAWWVAIYHMMIGGYLVFFAERRTPFILITGVVKGLLGTLIYLVVRDPPWVVEHVPWIPDILLLSTLFVMFIFSVLVTILIWQAFGLDAPQKRTRELLCCGRDWCSRQRRRFGR